MAKSATVTKIKEEPTESKQVDFDSLLDGFLKDYTPPKKGREATPELLAVREHFDSLKKGVDKGVPFKELAVLFSKATKLEFTEAKLRSQWTAEARKRGIKQAPKPRKSTVEETKEAA